MPVTGMCARLLLSPATQAERLRWVDTAPSSTARYGLHIGDFAGMIGHDGALPGFQTFMAYLPPRRHDHRGRRCLRRCDVRLAGGRS